MDIINLLLIEILQINMNYKVYKLTFQDERNVQNNLELVKCFSAYLNLFAWTRTSVFALFVVFDESTPYNN